MKFGKTLVEKRNQYPESWTDSCIDYNRLKEFLKTEVQAYSVNVTSAGHSAVLLAVDGNEKPKDRNGSEPTLNEILKARLTHLAESTPNFIEMLTANVELFNEFYKAQVAGLQGRADDCNADVVENRKILDDIVLLEKFSMLNFTGICKILKKHDKNSGFKVSEMFLSRLHGYEFYRSVGLVDLKKQLMDLLSNIKYSPSLAVIASAVGESVSSLVTGSHSNVGRSDEPLLPTHPAQWFPPMSNLSSQKIIITMSGPAGTDIMGSLLDILARYDIQNIDDFVFSRLYHNVTCSVLVKLNTDCSGIFHDLNKSARKWDAEVKFDVYDDLQKFPRSLQDAPYENRSKYTATVLNNNGLTSRFLSEWTNMLLQYRISVEAMRRLNHGKLCVLDMKLSVPSDTDLVKFRAEVFQLSSRTLTDVSLQPDDIFRRHKRLVIMDMDSTLIQQEVIDELARQHGVVDEVAKITHRAMNGEIDFKESLRQRVGLLKGAPVSILETVRKNLVFTEGAHFLCKALKKLGFKLAVISGGFIPLALHVKNELGLDYAFANQLKCTPDGQTLTGETVGSIVDAQRKAELLEVIAQAESISKEQVIAIGDGANDLIMLAAAGLGIAFNAKPTVQEKASTRINQKSLRNVMYLLGYSDEEVDNLVV